jgi:thioredoxin 1
MTVLKFSAAWCGPCRMLDQVIENVGDVGVEIVNVDIDQDDETPVKYQIRGVPTCVLVDDTGTEIKRKVGVMTADEFRAFVKA